MRINLIKLGLKLRKLQNLLQNLILKISLCFYFQKIQDFEDNVSSYLYQVLIEYFASVFQF